MASFKKTVAVDLDAVLCHYDGWQGFHHIGEARPGAADFMQSLMEYARVIVFTTRTNMDVSDRPAGMTAEKAAAFVKEALDRRGIPCDEVYIGAGKPLAAAFVDDRNVAISPNPSEGDFSVAINEVREMLARK